MCLLGLCRHWLIQSGVSEPPEVVISAGRSAQLSFLVSTFVVVVVALNEYL